MEPTEESTLKRQKLVIVDNPNEEPPTLPEVPREGIDLSIFEFRKLCKKRWFVDKTMLIKTLVGRPLKPGTSAILQINAPRRFGKTLNMDMVKTFVENREELKVENRKLFEDKKIFKEREFFEEHFGKYPVIHVNFISLSGENFEEYLEKFKELIYDTFNEHDYLLKSEKLCDEDKKNFNRYYCSDKVESLNKANLMDGLRTLSEYLYKHFDKKVYVLIDELDAPVSTGLYKDKLSKDDLERVILFIRQIITLLLKDNKFVGNGLLNTCHRIGGVVSANNIGHCRFLSKPICRFYGFTGEEVNSLLKTYMLSEEETNKVKDWYNGYSATDEAGKEVEIYSTWSILNYLDTKKIKNHWSSCALYIFQSIMLHDKIATKIQKLMDRHVVDINYVDKIQVPHVDTLKKMIRCPSSDIKESDADLFLQFIYEDGFLDAISEPEYKAELKIPNNEIRREFEQVLYSLDFFKRYFKFEERFIKEYTELLTSISKNPSDDESFIQLAQVIRDLYSNSPRLPKNEFELQTHLYFLTKNYFIETFGEVFTQPERKYKADIAVYIGEQNCGIIYETKFGRKCNSTSGLIQIKENQHYTVFETKNLLVDMDKMVLIGLHMSEDNQITVSYLVGDPKNFDEKNIKTVSTRK